MQATLEHYQVHVINDARGMILDRQGQALMRPGSGADALMGSVGLPDVWPDTRRAVPEQGRTGLEARFDSILMGTQPGLRGQFRDATGQPRQYSPLRIEPHRGANLWTSIDEPLQVSVSSLLSSVHQPESAAVVLDVKQGDVLAMDGRSHGRPALTAVKTFTPGSVFKLITAAAALESYRFDSTSAFFCPGHIDEPGLHMNCWSVHGAETLSTSLAQSCDVAFAQMGLRMGSEALQYMANRLGVADTGLQVVDGRRVLAEAEPGVVWRHPPSGPGELAHLAIGQQDVRLSPLSAAELALTIADGGQSARARLVTRIQKPGLRAVRYISPEPRHRVVSAWTATRLADDMRLSVTLPTGTAHGLADADLPVAVKTGTAELDDGRLVNAWVVGFAPVNHPEIAFCAFIGHAPTAEAHRAVQQIVRGIVAAYKQNRKVYVID